MPGETLGIMLLSPAHDRAHAAMALAAAAAALGRQVVLFGTGGGCRALLEDWSVLDDVGRDAMLRGRGVAGFGTLRDAARELKVRLLACESALKGESLSSAALAEGVEMAGMAMFLEAVGHGQLATF